MFAQGRSKSAYEPMMSRRKTPQQHSSPQSYENSSPNYGGGDKYGRSADNSKYNKKASWVSSLNPLNLPRWAQKVCLAVTAVIMFIVCYETFFGHGNLVRKYENDLQKMKMQAEYEMNWFKQFQKDTIKEIEQDHETQREQEHQWFKEELRIMKAKHEEARRNHEQTLFDIEDTKQKATVATQIKHHLEAKLEKLYETANEKIDDKVKLYDALQDRIAQLKKLQAEDAHRKKVEQYQNERRTKFEAEHGIGQSQANQQQQPVGGQQPSWRADGYDPSQDKYSQYYNNSSPGGGVPPKQAEGTQVEEPVVDEDWLKYLDQHDPLSDNYDPNASYGECHHDGTCPDCKLHNMENTKLEDADLWNDHHWAEQEDFDSMEDFWKDFDYDQNFGTAQGGAEAPKAN